MIVMKLPLYTRVLNKYVRQIGKIVNIFLMMAIFVLYGLEISSIINILVSYEVTFFIALIVNNLLFLFYAVVLKNEFSIQVRAFHNQGVPLESTEGFRYSRDAVDNSANRSITLNILIIVGAFLNFIPDLSGDPTSETLEFVSYFGISLVLIGMSLFLNIEYPDHSLLEPGNFISYHKPKSTPTFLNNLLADSLKSFLDPRTRFQHDNWVIDIENKLNEDFFPKLDLETRVDRAIEKIILLTYLQKKVPYLLKDENLNSHLLRIIQPDLLEEFIRGEKSGLPLKIFSKLVDRMIEDIPEIFKLVDRLLVEIMVNPSLFERTDKIIETVIPDEQDLDVQESFRILIFVLNMASNQNKRVIEVIAETSRHIEPPLSKIKFELESPEPEILELIRQHERENGHLVYSERIVRILSMMLQVGDTSWLQFIPQEYGKHVLNLSVTENEFQSYGTSVPLHVQFSLVNSLRKIFSSLSGIGGAIYPIIRTLFGNPLL